MACATSNRKVDEITGGMLETAGSLPDSDEAAVKLSVIAVSRLVCKITSWG
jgi:hypothetical protein